MVIPISSDNSNLSYFSLDKRHLIASSIHGGMAGLSIRREINSDSHMLMI